MHIVLTILKIIGIILLILLGIFLLLLLLLLFVPLRYCIRVRKEKETLEADGRMSWLLHFLRADLTFRDMKGTAVIRVCGFRLKTFHFPKKEEDDSQPQAGKETSEILVRPGAEEQNSSENATDAAKQIHSENATDAAYQNRHENPADAADRIESGHKSDLTQSAESETERERARSASVTDHEDAEKQSASGQKDGSSSKRGVVGRIIDLFAKLLSRVLDLLMQVPGLPVEVHDRLDALSRKLEARYGALSKKIDPFLSIEAEHMLPKIIRYVKFLIRGYAPRKITGYLHFGTGSPDLTGKLVGLIYVLLPEAGTEYDLDPDFYEAVLETDTCVKGHIRAYRLVWVAIRLLLDKEFRILFARVRGKEKVRKHRGMRRARRKAFLDSSDKAA